MLGYVHTVLHLVHNKPPEHFSGSVTCFTDFDPDLDPRIRSTELRLRNL